MRQPIVSTLGGLVVRGEQLSTRLYPWRFILIALAVALHMWIAYDFRNQVRAGERYLAPSTALLFGATALVLLTLLGAYWWRVSKPSAFAVPNRWLASGVRQFFILYFWGLVVSAIVSFGYALARLMGAT